MQIRLDGDVIEEAIGVPSDGEKWFKQQSFETDYSKFLLPEFEKLDWKNGIYISNLKSMWKIPLDTI